MLRETLRQATLEDIRNLHLLQLPFYANSNHEVLAFLRLQGIIDNSCIEEALETPVIRQAREYYGAIARTQKLYTIYADHVGRPEFLAYALGRGIFSEKEIALIPFDDGLNAKTFTQRYGKENLLSIIREELLNPKPLPESQGDNDPHPICECGH